MSKLRLSFACWNYDRTRALMDGSVAVDGIDLNYLNLPVEETFYRQARFQEFDVCEMSLSSYCVSLHRPDRPFVAIPVFPSRFFRHSCIYVNANSGINEPKDLIGKRIASPEYQMTAPVWIRGILSDHYGVPVDAQPYLFGGEEETGRIEKLKLQLPPNIQVHPIGPDQTLSKMLHDGELDALYTARMPSSFLKGDGKVKRLFENYVDVERAYYRQTGIFPIMHTVVMRREVYEANRWIAQSLTKAFSDGRSGPRDLPLQPPMAIANGIGRAQSGQQLTAVAHVQAQIQLRALLFGRIDHPAATGTERGLGHDEVEFVQTPFARSVGGGAVDRLNF
jgi:4,5-dihydroxyphthalate decarboxylase